MSKQPLHASQTSLTFLVLDSERSDIALTITSGEDVWNATLPLTDSEEYMLVDGRRAYETIDMLTTDYNNRWCASASIHEGGAAYEAAALKAEEMMWDMGFDHVEITQYPDDPDQLNIVGYNWGRVNLMNTLSLVVTSTLPTCLRHLAEEQTKEQTTTPLVLLCRSRLDKHSHAWSSTTQLWQHCGHAKRKAFGLPRLCCKSSRERFCTHLHELRYGIAQLPNHSSN